MKFAFSPEQEEFRSSVRRFLTDKSPCSEVRRLMATAKGYEPKVWQALCDDLGLLGLQVPEEYGGQGFGFVELAIVCEEMGRNLFCGPFLSHGVLATSVVLEAADESIKQRLLPAMVSGKHLVAFAASENDAYWDPNQVHVRADRGGDSYQLSGIKKYVLDGHLANHFVVSAQVTDNNVGFFLVDTSQNSLSIRALETIDQTRKLTEIRFNNTIAEPLGAFERGADIATKILNIASVALANEMVGGAQLMLETAVAYADTRVQFGRVIGSFQAIKHKCADMLLEIELARSAAHVAAFAAASNAPNLTALASHAKACASDAYVNAARECIQIHGGIGFTWDQDTHLWFKRAQSSNMLFGDPTYHRERYLCAIEASA